MIADGAGIEAAGPTESAAPTGGERRRAAGAHFSGLLLPWWWPMLARQSGPEPGFVDDHRRLAQRIQGVYILLGLASGFLVFVDSRFVLLQVLFWTAMCAVELPLARAALRGGRYRLRGVLSFGSESQ